MSQSNDGPPERDVKDFRFQQLCKVRVSAPLDEVRTDRSQWIATSNKFGLIFVGLKDGFKVLKTADICHVDGVNARDRSTAVISDFPFWSSVTMTNPISHLALSCDELTLVVVMKECGNLMLCMYDVRQFAVKTDSSVAFARCRLNASPGSSLLDIMWNPLDPTLLAVCVSDGSVELIRVTNTVQTVGSLPVSSNASCLNWSPKGRQLVIGRKDGTMIQFDQEMKEKRSWPMPSILATTHQVVDVTWLSTYVFLAAYLPSTAESSDQPQVLLTVSSKDGPTSYVNFEDVCYGSGEDRRHKYFFMFLAKWDMVVLSSSNATEAAVVAKHPDGGPTSVWEHWTLEDSGRAELPLTANHLDSFPMGVTLTLGCQTPITLGDNKTHPPSPILLMLSTDGLLVPYYLLNHNNGAPSLTVPLEQLTSTGARTSTDALQPSTPGSAMLGAQKLSQPVSTLGQGSTLPKTGSSFQFVQKAPTTASDTPGASLFSQPKTGLDTPGASLFSQPKPSSLPTTGSSFQFVTKPSQPTPDMPGRQAFTPVVTQVANVTPASGSQKTGMPFTPSSSGAPTAFSPATTKVQVLSTPSIGTKSVFGGNTGALDLGATKPDAEKAATLPSFGFSTVPSTTSSNTAGGVSGFGQPAGKSMFGGSTSFTGFGFPKPPPTTAPATSAAAAPTATSTPAAAQGVTSAGFGGNTFTKPTESLAQKNSTGGFGGFTMGQTVTPIPAPGRSPPSQAPPSLPPNSLPQASSKGVTLGVKRDIEEEARQSEEEAPLPPPYEKPSVNETVESTFTRSIMEEMQHFEKELHDLKLRSGNSLKEVGTRKEMLDLRRATEDMAKFCHDIKENTKEQSREVHDHKSLCLELFAMAEECRVRQERNDDPKYHKLLRSRALDPASADKLKQLQAQYQAQSQGLVEVDLILDQQWEEHQDRKKAIKGRLQAPTSDMVYRAVKSNHNLIHTQKTQLEKLQENLKNLQLYNRSADWQNMSMFRTDTSRSPDITSLVNSLGRGSAQPGLSLAGSVSPEKTAQLRQFLAQRTVPRIRSTKPGNLSMSRIVAAKGLREKLEDVRSPRSSPGGDQTTPLQLVRPREEYSDPTGGRTRFLPTGQGNLKKLPPTNNNAISQARSQSDLHPARSVQITAAMKNNNSRTDSQQRGFGGLEPVYRNTGRGVSSEELTSAMLRMKETLTATYSGGGQHPDVEDISPSFTPELESDEQEGLTEEDEGEYDDEEDDDDEEEAGFGVEYSLESRTDASGDNEQNQHKHRGSAGTPLSSLHSAVPTDQKAGVSKNLFGGSKTFISDQLSTGKLSTSTPAMMAKQPSNTPPVPASGFGFSTELGASGLAGKSLFGSGSAGDPRVKTPDVDACAEDEATAGKIQAKGFSFSTAPSTTASTTTASTAPSGFSFTVPGGNATATSGAAAAGGFSFGANSGIFSKPSTETEKPQSTSFSAFGGGTFGGKSDTTTTTTPSVTSSVSAAAVTAALSSSLLAALTDTSTTSTSAASVTASAALGSSLLAALTDASSTAPQEAAAALSSFSFKPGDSPSQPTQQGNTSLAVSGATTTVSTSADTPATAVTAAASNLFGLSSGGFGQPAKFGGSPPGGATTTTTTAQFGGSAGVFDSTGPTSFGALATTTQVSSTDDTTTTSTTSATVTKSLFGTTPTTSASTAAFGQTATASTEAAATPSQAAATTTTAESTGFAFGSSSSTTSIFGGSSAANTSSAFGGGTATTGVFASSTATTTTPSVFGTTAPGTATSGFGFGQNTTGFAKPSFGQSPGFSQTSSFGGGSGAFGAGGSVFGQTATTTSSSAFGQSTTTTTASSEAVVFGGGGGGLFGGLGGKPSADKANKNVFGGGTFGTTDNTQNTGLFGNAGSTSFGGKSDGGFGSGGGFSGGSGVAATGFGVGQSTQAPAGFGGQPSFGGSPSLGTSSFGGAPSFGSPGGGFGTSAAFTSPVGTTATFGSAGGQGGFASFASGNSPTFGNIAQSSAPSFGNLATSTGGGFGAAAGGFGNTAGGFGSPAGGFGSPAGGFGSPAGGGFGATQPTGGFGATQPTGGFGATQQGGGFGATQQGGGFGATQQGGGFGSPQPGTGGNFGSSPQFTSYRG
ncbi:nuclear pore complex protein Nup214-like isoform X2 [Haliotis rufescens]|uniref:nuclear pore complex protein Nup214-like isoform X2 n=1 Tax=Haliotis rufescens TaxID=6454 RepID=UPI00201F3E4E|nr:nuclear pore complex protein Nup214-like isoform X2 [Haliotis rufescens]